MKRMKLKYPDSWEVHWERRNHYSEIHIDKIKADFTLSTDIEKEKLFDIINNLLLKY